MPGAEAPAAEAVETEVSTSAETTETIEQTQAAEKPEAAAAETTAPPAAEPTARERLEANVRAKLDALDADDDDESEPADKTADPEPEAEKPAPEAAAAVTPAPTLPDAHVRSLKAFGLSDAEIQKTSPEVAAALHARRNQEITRWAEAGRQAKAAAATPTQTQAAAVPATTQTPAAKPPLDIAALKQQYGDEPLIAALEAQQKEIAEARAFQQRYEAEIQQRQLETLGKQIDGFFSSKELAAYHAVYGTDSAKLTAEQLNKRQEVLQLADVIVGGARQGGVNLTLEQALQHAFDSVAAPLAKQAARAEIKKELTQRAKGLSLKPGGRPAPKGEATRKDLEKNVKANLRKLFNS